MVMRRALAALLLCVFASCAIAGLPDTIARIKPSIVVVATFSKLRSPALMLRGTGFVVGDGSVVATNSHVVPEVLEEGEALVVLIPVAGAEPKVVPAQKLARRPEYDVGLMRIQERLPAFKAAAPDKAREGSEVAFTGFPLGNALGMLPVTHRGIISSITYVATPGGNAAAVNSSAIRRLRSGPFLVYQLDATAYPGNSGGPLYDADSGELFGMVSSVWVKGSKESALSAPSGITFAIPARFLLDVMGEALGTSGKP